MAVSGAAIVAALPGCSAGQVALRHRPPARAQVRTTVEHFLDALAHGDGETACGLLSPAGVRNAAYTEKDKHRACVRQHSQFQELGRRTHITKIRMTGSREALTLVRTTGGEGGSMLLRRYGHRWLIDND